MILNFINIHSAPGYFLAPSSSTPGQLDRLVGYPPLQGGLKQPCWAPDIS
jgi:hypothetical protein